MLFFQKIKTPGLNKCTFKYWGHELMSTKRFNSENNNNKNSNLVVITTTYNIITILTILIVKILLTMVL